MPPLATVQAATRRGLVSLIATKLDLPVGEVVASLNTLFDDRQIRLERSPDRGVFIEGVGLSPELAEEVAATINGTVDARLEGVDRLVDAILAGTLAAGATPEPS